MSLDVLKNFLFRPLQNMMRRANSFENKITGAGLTGAEREANAFTKMMSDTQHQRGVADMQAAGLNPALLYGSGSSGAAASASVSPDSGTDFGQLVQAFTLPKQLEQMNANIALSRANADKAAADAAKSRADTDLSRQSLDFNDKLFVLREESMRLSNENTDESIKNARAYREEIRAQINLLEKQAETEEEKKLFTEAQANLARMSEQEIRELLPYKKSELAARTEQEHCAATFSAVQAGIQSHLYRIGYFDSQFNELQEAIRQRSSDADAKDAVAQISQLRVKMANGEFIDTSDFKWYQIGQKFAAEETNKLLRMMTTASIAVNGNPVGQASSVAAAVAK